MVCRNVRGVYDANVLSLTACCKTGTDRDEERPANCTAGVPAVLRRDVSCALQWAEVGQAVGVA